MGFSLKQKFNKLSVKIMAVCIIFGLAISVLAAIIGYTTYVNNVYTLYKKHGEMLLRMVERVVDPDVVRESIERREKSTEFQGIQTELDDIKDLTGVEYIYLIRVSEDKTHVENIMFAFSMEEKDDPDYDAYLELLTPDYNYGHLIDDFLELQEKRGEVTFIKDYIPVFGEMLSSHLPIFCSADELVGILSVDIPIAEIREVVREYIYRGTVGTFLLLFMYVLLYSGINRKIILEPINRLTMSAKSFINRDSDEPVLVSQFPEIHSGDEFQLLADAFVEMETSIQDYNKNLEKKVEERTSELRIKNEELTKALNTIQEVQEQLIKLDAHKTETLYMVTHDLRTPMTSIVGFSDLMANKFESTLLPVILKTDDKKYIRVAEQILDNLIIIRKEGMRLTDLINNFLDLSKLEEGKITLDPEQIIIADIVKEAVDSLRSLIEHKRLKTIISIETELMSINADRGKLTQVMVNLLSNSIKFTEEGSITCRVIQDKENNQVIVSITDTGGGISIDEQESIFEKFTQAGEQDGSKQKGTGLGLPICKQIIELHGGQIWVESEPGQGSTFSFSLPV